MNAQLHCNRRGARLEDSQARANQRICALFSACLLTIYLGFSFVLMAEAQSVQLTARQVARRALLSLVVVVVEDSKGQQRFGSGFFVSADLVATNYHVIKGGEHLKIVGRGVSYDVFGTVAIDLERDLCVIRVVSNRKGQRLTLASNGPPAVGDEVYVAGNPEGLEGTFSQGIVSSIRQINHVRYIQITAPLSPGSSGGPVLNRRGQVVGVATAGLSSGQNLNFAVPVSYLSPLVAASVRAPKDRIVANVHDLPADEDEARAWDYRREAQTYYRKNRYRQALDALEEAISVKPDYGDAYYYKALILRDLARYGDAIAAAEKAVQCSPKDCTDHYLLGGLYLLIGDKQSTRSVCARLDSLGCRELSDELLRAIR